MWVNKNRCSFQIACMSHSATRETGHELQLQLISHDPPKKISWGVIFPPAFNQLIKQNDEHLTGKK